jgi:hypothetical protein
MGSRASLILLLAGIAPAQVSFPPAGNALATLAHQPETRVTWSKEVGRLESGESRAVFTVLTVENSNQPGRRAQGVRIDLSSANGKSTLYLDEVKLQPEKKIFDHLIRDAGRSQGGTLSFVGSCEFRDNPGVYPLNADFEYAGPQAPALRIFSSTGDQIMFPGLTPSHLSTVLGEAIDELKSH